MRYIIPFLLLSISSAAAQQGQAVGPYISPTAPSFSTSVTSPLHIGGSGTTGTQFTLQTTTGNGTTDQFAFNGGNNGATPFGLFSAAGFVVGSTTATLGTSLSGAAVPYTGANTNNAILAGLRYSAPGALGSFVNLTSSRGAAPGTFSAIQAGDGIGGVVFTGDNGASYTSRGATIRAVAVTNWSGAQNDSKLVIGVTATGATVPTDAFTIQQSGGVTVGNVATDPLIGGMFINGQQFMPNITTSSAAQTGTVCWTTGTGKFTVDTTVGCLTSIMGAKSITERLAPTKALDIVARLDPFAFRYKPGYGDDGRYEQFGLGAEEVALADERLVGRDPEGTLSGVRYQEMTAVLAGAIQKLKADNDNLRACQQDWKCRIFGIGE